jgi:hypothetical protein
MYVGKGESPSLKLCLVKGGGKTVVDGVGLYSKLATKDCNNQLKYGLYLDISVEVQEWRERLFSGGDLLSMVLIYCPRYIYGMRSRSVG